MIKRGTKIWEVDIFVDIFIPSFKKQMPCNVSCDGIFHKKNLAILYFSPLFSPILLSDFCYW